MFYIKKYVDENRGVDYIRAEDIFDNRNEEDPKIQYVYMFLSIVEKELNYYCNNSSTAFGNPDLAKYQGQVRGWLMAKQWDWEEKTLPDKSELILIRSRSGRIIMKIEKPALPKHEIERRREISKDLDALGF